MDRHAGHALEFGPIRPFGDGLAGVLVQDNGVGLDATRRERVDRERGVVQRPEPGARDHYRREIEIGDEVDHLPIAGERHSNAADAFHQAAEAIPGVGQVYGGFREMSETVANGEESFRDVKLVEYPHEGSYSMAFVTADAPDHLEDSVDHEEGSMMSLFLPMGPNPVMGGFVIYVARDRVHDIDIGVDEGLQANITSGVTISDDDEDGHIGERMQQRIEDP